MTYFELWGIQLIESWVDVKVELDSDPSTEIFAPLQQVLDQTKAIKVLSRQVEHIGVECSHLDILLDTGNFQRELKISFTTLLH